MRAVSQRSRVMALGGALGVAALIAGCGGSSGSTSSITVGNEANNTAVASTPTTPPSGNGKTPTSGPLSQKPTVTPPKGPAPTTLVTKDLITGSGRAAKAGDNVTVNYVGVLYSNGKEFDSSWKRNQPFSFPLGQGQVIPGWDQGVVGMKVGGRRELTIPAKLAYGAQGQAGIPPNSPLVFVVDMLGIQ